MEHSIQEVDGRRTAASFRGQGSGVQPGRGRVSVRSGEPLEPPLLRYGPRAIRTFRGSTRDSPPARYTSNAFVVGHVGRFEPVKNYDFLLDLAARYTSSNDDAFFVLVGDGVLLPMLQQRAQEVLPGRIRFLGARDDVPELLLGLFDAFLLSSLAEGLPISLLEAQAAGLPAGRGLVRRSRSFTRKACERLNRSYPAARGWIRS